MSYLGTEIDDLKAELRRRYQTADMMVTMHSVLRDQRSRNAFFLDILVFLFSFSIAALAFVDPDLLTWLPWSDTSSRIAIGIIAIVIFFVSLVASKVDWKGQSESHDRAASSWTEVKFRLRDQDRLNDLTNLRARLSFYDEIARNSIVIPESVFLRLKSEHLLKRRISRILNKYPAAPVKLTRLRLRWRHSRKTWNQKSC